MCELEPPELELHGRCACRADKLAATHPPAGALVAPGPEREGTPDTPMLRAMRHLHVLDEEQERRLFQHFQRVPARHTPPPGWRSLEEEVQVRAPPSRVILLWLPLSGLAVALAPGEGSACASGKHDALETCKSPSQLSDGGNQVDNLYLPECVCLAAPVIQHTPCGLCAMLIAGPHYPHPRAAGR